MRYLATIILSGVFALNAQAGQIGQRALDALSTTLPKADVVLLGEVHDNPWQHENQARAVTALGPKALVFEMLTPKQAARITAENRKNSASLEKALGWNKSGWPDFSMYYPIFAAAPKARIYGANLPRAEVRRAVTEGAAKVFGKGAARFGLDRPLARNEQKNREQGQMEAHCNALPKHLLSGMVAAQRLRDAALARAILTARRDTGGRVAVITGNGHARRDWDVPAVLAIAAPELSVLSIGQFEVAPEGAVPYDLYLVTPAAKRKDPRAVFQKKTP